MTFIPVSTQLLQAIKTKNSHKVENLLSNSDTKRDLIIEHISINGKESLIKLLPSFKSKGLVLIIQTILDN